MLIVKRAPALLVVVGLAATARGEPPVVEAVVAREIAASGEPVDGGGTFGEDVPRLTVAWSAPAAVQKAVIRWTAAQTEWGPPGRKLCERTQNLAAGRGSSVCSPPGGFEPGAYQVEIAAGDAGTVTVPFSVTPIGAPAQPAVGLEARANLAAAASGGRVRLATSEANDGDWAAANLIDGLIDAPRKDRPRSNGWAATSAKPQELVLSFHEGREARVDAVVIDPRANGGATRPEASPKLVEVWLSTSARPAEGLTRVASARLVRGAGEQLIPFPATAARMVSLRILSTYGQPARLGEIKVLEAAGASILADFKPAPEPAPDMPTPRPIDPEVAARLAGASPVAIDAATDVTLDHGKGLFRLELPAGDEVVLHVAALGIPGAMLRVLDGDGAALVSRAARPSAWHGKLGAGTYYVSLGTMQQPLKPADDSPEAKSAATPAVLVIRDPALAAPTPFQAAQLGLDYLQAETPAWQNANGCGGCHVQTLALLGMAVARRNGYRVQDRVAVALGDFVATRNTRNDDKLELFRKLGVRAYVDGFAPGRAALADAMARGLLEQAPPDFVFKGRDRRPVEQGAITATSLAVQVLAPLARPGAAPEEAERSGAGLRAALSFLDAAPARTVQDHALRILAYVAAGARNERLADEVASLLVLQNEDGGFGEKNDGGPSNAYGTGQALYALRTAGFAVADRRYARGVAWLMERQRWNGSWPRIATDATTEIAHTMWAVLGLAGSYDRSGPTASAGALDVLLVPVRVVAQDSSGRTLNDLKPADFKVREDDVEQRVVSVRRESGDFTIAMVMDRSGSIRAALPTMIQAATEFLGLLGPRDRVSVVEFSDRPEPPSELTTDRAASRARLQAMTAKGGTALYDALQAALVHVAAQPSPRAIVLITDGKDENDRGDGPGSGATLKETLARLAAGGVPVYAIGLGKGVEKGVLNQIAGASGGRAYFVNMPRDLPRLYADLAAALRSQYVLVYRSSRPADDKWRKISVEVVRPGARVDATPGFLATRPAVR